MKAIKNLSELSGYIIEVQITMPDGDELVVPMRTLTHKEWFAIEREVPDPPRAPNELNYNKKKADGQYEMYFDREHPDYQRALREAAEERDYRRLLYALEHVPDDYQWQAAGAVDEDGEPLTGPVEIDGDTPEERLKVVRTLDVGVCANLLAALRRSGGFARVIERASSFQ